MATRWCGPFTHANKARWWLFPPVDIDITWKGGKEFEWDLLTPYSNADGQLVRFLLLNEDNGVSPEKWLTDQRRPRVAPQLHPLPRAVEHEVEPDVELEPVGLEHGLHDVEAVVGAVDRAAQVEAPSRRGLEDAAEFARGGKQARTLEDPSVTKDSTTYYRERRRVGGPGR